MNSMSRYYDYDPCGKGQYDPCNKAPNQNCLTTLKCSCPSSFKLPGVTLATSFTVTSLRLNMSKFKNPCVRLEFLTNLDIVGITVTDNLQFQIFKQCDNQSEAVPVGPSWTFGPVGVGSDTFSFFVCDCDCDPCLYNCCTYTVRVTSAIAITVGSISIGNATLSGIITENSCCC